MDYHNVNKMHNYCINDCYLTLEPVHLVGVSAIVMRAPSPGPRGEHVHQFEMFAILKHVVIKPRILGLVARKSALPWHTFSATLAGAASSC